MQQTILSQVPSSGVQQDTAGPKTAASSRRSEKGDSLYDQVSRAQDASPNDQAASNTASSDADKSPAAGTKQQSSQSADETESAPLLGEPQDLAEAPAPLTFANLQSLMPANGPATTPEGAVNMGLVNGGLPGKPLMANGLNGQGTSTAGLASNSQFAELLAANVTTETARPVDSAGLLSSPRFQSSLDSAAQQAMQGKLAGEANVPLRGYSTTVDVPVGQAEWGDKVMGKLSWLTAKNLQVAEIHLTPPDMGPMEVKVRVHNDQAAVTVHAANPVVREQLELHSNRLRDMLAEQGVSLSEFDVSDQAGNQTNAQGEGSEHSDGSGHAAGGLTSGDFEEQEITAGRLDLAWKGEVDVFA
ncbi:flagellar hook-length control protein FliK [Marinobacter sp.]|uniref:flagellar hook-length control protein FliK n=1 Tax=Marinobacter sp. TaxID=50741 RepID=UPI002B26E403|nr:flagellar hook-length control protein FliK [Marinobacter sp.]